MSAPAIMGEYITGPPTLNTMKTTCYCTRTIVS